MNFPASGDGALSVVPLPAFSDNYIWMLRRGAHVVAIDPGDASVVQDWLQQNDVRLEAILITHHHSDHTGGILELTRGRDIPVYGPAAHDIAGVTQGVAEGERVELPQLGLQFEVLEVPGHTTTHIAFFGHNMLFPGDTLFSAGCGRLLGGTAEQLHHSLERLKQLPGDTQVYCTHEYTLSNLRFAQAAEPDNPQRDEWLARCEQLRARGEPTLPSKIATELAINPFLRTEEEGVLQAIARHSGKRPQDALQCFTSLRRWKDVF